MLWRPRLLGASNQGPIHATVVVFDEIVPSYVILQYRESGNTVWTAVDLYDDGLHGDGATGDRSYGNSFTVAGTVTQLDYRFADQEVQSQMGQGPFYWTGDIPGMYWVRIATASGVQVLSIVQE